jgi:hypothetical protein
MIRYTLEQRVYFRMTATCNKDLLESGGENFDINFMMREFPPDKQLVLWLMNLQQRNF